MIEAQSDNLAKAIATRVRGFRLLSVLALFVMLAAAIVANQAQPYRSFAIGIWVGAVLAEFIIWYFLVKLSRVARRWREREISMERPSTEPL